MIEPSLVLQSSLRAALIASPAVAALVPADQINSGWMRPDELPCINIRDGISQMRGRAAGGQFVAFVVLDIHIWALEDGTNSASIIGAAVAHALMQPPQSVDPRAIITDFKRTRTVWPRDPQPEFGHGVLNVEAAIYWKL